MINLGVIGTSAIVESFMRSTKYFPELKLKAVMSPRQSNVDQFINEYQFEKGYTNFNELINNSEIDLLYIASPNVFHYEQTKKALESRIHVLCEKPITLSLKELEELENIAKKNHVYLMEAMRPVHHPHIKMIKENINQLDGLHYAQLNFMRYSSKYDAYKRGENPRVFNKDFGGGALNDLGVYPLTLAVLLFGKPNHIMVSSVMLDTGVDATTTVSLHYGSFICDCSFSKVSTSYNYNVIQGEKKSLLLSHVTHLDELILVEEQERQILFNNHIQDDIRFEIEAMLNLIKNQDDQQFNNYLKITKQVTDICDQIREKLLVKD